MNLEELILQSDLSRLYCDIKSICTEMKNLPIDIKRALIGFGKFDGYYMFWIAHKGDGIFQFAYRLKYVEDRSDANVQRIRFTESNRTRIFECIENIYKSFCNIHPDYRFAPVKVVAETTKDQPLQNYEIGYFDELIKKLEASLTNLRHALNTKENVAIDLNSLETRTRNIFIKYHIYDYVALSECEAQRIIKWRQCGKKTIQNIIKLLDNFCGGTEVTEFEKCATTYVGDKPRYYTIDRVKELLEKEYYSEYKLSDKDVDEFGQYAAVIVESFKNYIQAFERSTLQERYIGILCDYIFDDSVTLQSVGDKYNISRERVRQVIMKYRRRLKGAFYKSEYLSYSTPIQETFLKVSDKAFIHFIAFSLLSQSGKRFTSVIFQCLFDNEVSEAIIATAGSLIYKIEPLNKSNERIADLLSKAVFPCGTAAKVNLNDIEFENEISEFSYKENLLLKLSQSNYVKGIVRNPKLIYCVTSSTTHTPDFCILTKDDKLILIVTLPTINMAISYNLNRFRELHRFCKENGYGYLIVDDRFNTIIDLKNSEVDKKLSETLLQILNQSGRIVWRDIQRLKSKFRITNSILAAFIIQNKLTFTLEPYIIKYCDRKTDTNNASVIKEEENSTSLRQISENKNEIEPVDTQNCERKKKGNYIFICDENGEILTDLDLFEQLRKLRINLAEAENLPAYCVFSNSVLVDLATYKPTTEEEWLTIKGLGAVKLVKYGEPFLKVIKEYIKD